jgi:hypothetical protein
MRLRFSLVLFALLTSIAGAHTAAAQTPFAGTWKLNQEKSQLTGDLMKFRPAQDQSIELAAGGTTYSFRTDGKPYALPSGDVAIWRQNGEDSWTTEYRKVDNKLLSSDNWKLSADGNTLTITTTGAKANGDLYTDTATYLRTAGTGGLMGDWKSTEVKIGSPNELIIQVAGLDRLLFKIPAMKATCQVDFDGKDAIVEGPDIPAGLRLSLTRTGPYSFKLVQKLNGSIVSSSVYTVAADDPNTMTAVGGAPGDPPATLIWEKQAPPPPPATPKPTVGAPVRP